MTHPDHCKKCKKDNWCGIEYAWDHPEYYDGVSEWRCMDCNYRLNRWTGEELKEGQWATREDRYRCFNQRPSADKIKEDFGDVLLELSKE